MATCGRRARLAPALAGALLFAAAPGRAAPAPGAPVVVLDVPFVAQSALLCGGAAAAMVLRYWGVEDVLPVDFEPLVDASRGGIPTGALVEALAARGWEAHPFRGDPAPARGRIDRGRPVIALIEVAPGRYHYVVLVAWRSGRVLLHDPARGPFQLVPEAELVERWRAAGSWALLLLPGGAAAAPPEPAGPAPAVDGCERLVDEAVDEVRAGALGDAERRLSAAAALCPGAARPLRELAGLRFREESWGAAVSLAERATALDPGDAHAWRLLATSRFLDDDPEGALDAWNRVAEPRLDLVELSGFERTRRDVAERQLGLRPRAPLTRAALARSRRRLEAMPTVLRARVDYRPLGGGRARLEAAVLERGLLPGWRALVATTAVDAATRRETRLALASPLGGGGRLDLGGRWWRNRPAVWLEARVPGGLGLAGVTRVALGWDEQSYRLGEPLVERRLSAGVVSEQWWREDLRLEWGVGLDRWRGRGEAPSLRAAAEQRLAGDRLALALEGAAWWPAGGAGFGAWSARLAARTSAAPGRLAATAGIGYHAASREAPLGLWPGAGTGTGRPLLLRAHPLLEDGVVTGEGFGRRLLHGELELQARLVRLGPLALRAAAFLDLARPWDGPGAEELLADAGVGLRIGLPGPAGMLRIDAARPLTDRGGIVLSAAWERSWPN